jgi:hypothetical protein
MMGGFYDDVKVVNVFKSSIVFRSLLFVLSVSEKTYHCLVV